MYNMSRDPFTFLTPAKDFKKKKPYKKNSPYLVAAKSDSINIKKKTPPNYPTFNCNTFILHGKKICVHKYLVLLQMQLQKLLFFIKITVSEAFF